MSWDRWEIEGPIEGRNSGVPANILIWGIEQLFTVIGSSFVMWLEPAVMVFVGAVVLGARANRSPKITGLSPCGNYTGGYRDIDSMKGRGRVVVRAS